MHKILYISAHPDDESLGCGGTMLKYANLGCDQSWLIATSIINSSEYNLEDIKKRKEEIIKVEKKIKFNFVRQFEYIPATLDSIPLLEMIKKVSSIFNELKPDTIFLPNRSDAHSDHRYLFDVVMACTKSFRFPFIKKILMYECLSETEFAPSLQSNLFNPNYFVDISSFMNEKINLLNIYSSELGEHPFPRSIKNIEALATYRGSFAGVKYAEAFQLLKYID